MSFELSRDNIVDFFKKRQNPIIGFLACFLLTIPLQLTGFGIAIIVAGIFGGFLIKRSLWAIIANFLGGFLGWLTLFGMMFVFNPAASFTAWFMVGVLMPAPQVFVSLIGGVITGVGGQLGSLFAEAAFQPEEDELKFPRKPKPEPERVPTEELPRRKRVKRKKKKKKSS